jgi:hypothetical protein
MTRYYLLIANVEADWRAKSEDEKEAVFEVHNRFVDLLAERGHTVAKGYGAALADQSTAVTVRASGVTDGPYTESAEHLAGLYVVDSDDRDDLVECCRLLATVEPVIEVRAKEEY